MQVVQLANFYGPRSGGLRTALHHLGEGYTARGHDVVLVVPGERAGTEALPGGVHRVTVPAPRVPGTGGYRLADPRRVADVLAGLRPDVLEVSDRLTLRGFGGWARRRGVGAVVVSHERLDRLLGQVLPGPVARRAADVANRRLAAQFDTVVCTTPFAAQEFDRVGATNVVRVPLGVDLAAFHPRHHDPALRARLAAPDELLLVHCGRLSPEKRVERSVAAAGELHRAGVPVRLVVAGDGPRRAALERRAAGLPVRFTGHVGDRRRVAALLATADVSLAPGPHETFGLAALEALATGTPVVASGRSALAELVGTGAGAVAPDSARGFADAVGEVAARPEDARRRAARARAEELPWGRSVDGMLAVLAGGGAGRPRVDSPR